jgi:hypothetical protein
MYIKSTRRYYTYDGQQNIHRQWFLILAQDKDHRETKEIRCFVRKVAMHQFGHFMMGYAKIHSNTYTVSGSYGGDGLPMDLPHSVWEKGVPLPQRLYDLWSKGGGWNGAGSEAREMAKWANENMDLLAPERYERERW